MSRDWWCRSLAGAVLGATLALALSGLFAWWGPGGVDARDKMQFVMWLIAPLWMTALACVYFVRSGRHAVVALLCANGLAWAALAWTRWQAGA